MVTISSERATRLGGLRRFAVAITALNVLGHAFLGFEQSWAQPLVALATAYSMEILLEICDSWVNQRTPRFIGGPQALIDFLLSAHITALAVAMLLYSNERLLPVAFATSVAMGSKFIFRIPTENGSRHFFNPSNLGITVTLLLFPWIGIAPPYHFTENISGPLDWALPGLIILSGTFLNARFAHRLPLIGAWLSVFIAQALLRSVVFDTSVVPALLPITGLAFVLYTFYMVTDPATTPNGTREQLFFGAAVAVVYAVLISSHVVFGLFFALSIVCGLRGTGLYLQSLVGKHVRSSTKIDMEAPAAVAGRIDL